MPHTKEDIIAAIARLGSASAAANELGVSRQAIHSRFKRLPEEDPLRQRYEALVELSKPGPDPQWEDSNERIRHNVRAYRERQEKSQNLEEKS